MYRKNRVLKRMIEEHMNKGNSPTQKYNDKKYYMHSSMEFEKDTSTIKDHSRSVTNTKLFNGNKIRNHRGSTGNLHSYYQAQTSTSGSQRASMTTKINSSSTPFKCEK